MIATETPHHVSIALNNAATSHAPNRYQTSVGSSRPCLRRKDACNTGKVYTAKGKGKNSAEAMLGSFKLPSKSLSAKTVVE